ncbi:hypothetical protein [Streptomyces avermitilis]
MTDRMRVARLKDFEGNLVELREWLSLNGRSPPADVDETTEGTTGGET